MIPVTTIGHKIGEILPDSLWHYMSIVSNDPNSGINGPEPTQNSLYNKILYNLHKNKAMQ